jgi:cytochrome c
MTKPAVTVAACAVMLFSALTLVNARPLDATSSAVPGDAVRGKTVFEKRCTGCHTLEQNRVGPRLAGVYGRKSGTVPDFPYSKELKQVGIVWGDRSLDAWLTDPDTLVPGNEMSFQVARQDERRDLIAFLKASSTGLNVSEAR